MRLILPLVSLVSCAPGEKPASDTAGDTAGHTDCVASAEVCDGVDNDCDGEIDEDAADAPSWFVDSDGDGFGEAGSVTVSCAPPSGTVSDGTDCDDSDSGVHPGATERCDGLDTDCDGSADPAGAATWTADGGAPEDWSAVLKQGDPLVLPEAGTLALCSGSWPVALSTSDSLRLVGYPDASAVALEAGPGDTTVSIDGAERAEITGLTVRGGLQGIALSAVADARISGVVLAENGDYATGRAAAVVSEETVLSVSDTTFHANRASGSGGALRHSGGSLSVSDSLFSENDGDSNVASGLHVSGASLTLVSVEFSGNTGGRAVYLDGVSGSLEAVVFAENRTGGDSCSSSRASLDSGAALYARDSTVTIEQGSFDGNAVYCADGTAWGGALVVEGGVFDVADSSFTENLVFGDTTYGGAVYLDGAEVSFTRTDFSLHAAHYGGAIAAVGGSVVSVSGGAVSQNDAATRHLDGGGGALVSGDAELYSFDADWGSGKAANDGGDVLTGAGLYTCDGVATFWCGASGCAP